MMTTWGQAEAGHDRNPKLHERYVYDWDGTHWVRDKTGHTEDIIET